MKMRSFDKRHWMTLWFIAGVISIGLSVLFENAKMGAFSGMATVFGLIAIALIWIKE